MGTNRQRDLAQELVDRMLSGDDIAFGHQDADGMSNKLLGSVGEELAARYLEQRGYGIIVALRGRPILLPMIRMTTESCWLRLRRDVRVLSEAACIPKKRLPLRSSVGTVGSPCVTRRIITRYHPSDLMS
jgi:hypothetical protein